MSEQRAAALRQMDVLARLPPSGSRHGGELELLSLFEPTSPNGPHDDAKSGLGGPPPPPFDPPPDAKGLFRVYRDYLNHEHNLINHRLSWNFTIQGFLFAAYTLALGKVADIRIALSQKTTVSAELLEVSLHDLQIVVFTIAIVGFSVSIAVLLSVTGALLSMDSLRERWSEVVLDNQGKLDDIIKKGGFPDIMGGGHRLATAIGFYAPISLPLVLALAWALIGIDGLTHH